MAKFFGVVGYNGATTETAPGIWEETIVERDYYGDILKNTTRRLESGESLNDNVTVNTVISIVADPYAVQHFFAIRYVAWMGAKWKITNVEIQSPRLLLTLGGVYNGP